MVKNKKWLRAIRHLVMDARLRATSRNIESSDVMFNWREEEGL